MKKIEFGNEIQHIRHSPFYVHFWESNQTHLWINHVCKRSAEELFTKRSVSEIA